MKNYLHYEFDLDPSDVIEVTLANPANVRLLDDANYAAYANGEPHRYYGGHVTSSPIQLEAPWAGHWHVVIDLGGYPGTIAGTARILEKTT